MISGKCCKCLKSPDRPIQKQEESEPDLFFLVADSEGSFAHPCLDENGEIDMCFKAVDMDYEPLEGETLWCEDCFEQSECND